MGPCIYAVLQVTVPAVHAPDALLQRRMKNSMQTTRPTRLPVTEGILRTHTYLRTQQQRAAARSCSEAGPVYRRCARRPAVSTSISKRCKRSRYCTSPSATALLSLQKRVSVAAGRTGRRGAQGGGVSQQVTRAAHFSDVAAFAGVLQHLAARRVTRLRYRERLGGNRESRTINLS